MVDPLVTERERCVNSFDCHGFRHAFEACQSRVNDEGIKENCTPEFFDLLECRDKCVSEILHNIYGKFISTDIQMIRSV